MARKHYRHGPICPQCGEESTALIDGLCVDCQPADARQDDALPDDAPMIAYAADWPI